jgi:ABC-type transport system involved in multi-copper enzyme maturation permease subunit
MTVPPDVAANQTGETAAVAPIADLSYRHYDGPLKDRKLRWWIVALVGVRWAIKRWWFWLLFLLSSASYGFWALMLFVQSRLGPDFQQMMFQTAKDERFATVLFRSYDGSLFWLMVMALVVGAPSIAADNRTNALQVYLAKPLTKADYLLGKWAGVFTVVFAATLLPSLFLYSYCMLSFWSEGFFRNEPWLIVRVLGVAAMSAAGFASLFVGVSAWCRSTMMSAAIGAGLYLATGIMALILWMALHMRDVQAGNPAAGALLQNASISGVLKSMAWNVYGVTIQFPVRGPNMPDGLKLPPPNIWVIGAAYAGIVLFGLLAARMRIRAVEVVTG